MLRNYFKMALRNLRKNREYAFLNLIGLALGMACAVLIFLWVNDELQYNRFHKNYEDLYLMMQNQTYDTKTFTFPATTGRLAPAIKQEFPEVEFAARTDWGNQILLESGDKKFYEPGYHADPDFLRMFSFELKEGNKNAALNDPSSIVITEELAKKLFGTDKVMGKTVKIDHDKSYTITGIAETPPLQSSYRFSWLIPFKVFENENKWLERWGNSGIMTFVKLKHGSDPRKVNEKLYGFIQKREPDALSRPHLFSIKDWRLRNKFENGKQAGGRIEFIRLFSGIALLIIIIACINFMNLATARSEHRAKEVGVRKVMGAGKSMLMRQFMGESITMAFLSMFLAAIIVMLALPSFNKLVFKQLTFSLGNPVITVGMPSLALLCGILAGSYPSVYLSSFNPISIFRGMKSGKNSSVVLIRKGLVVLQFVISIALIVSTVIIYQQIQYAKNRELGYVKDNMVYMPVRGKMIEHFDAIHTGLVNSGFVENAALANSQVLNFGSNSGDYKWEGKDPTKETLTTIEFVNPNYISTLHMKILAGRDFYTDGVKDSNNVIINETLAHLMGKKDPVGSLITNSGPGPMKVVGMVKDFLYNDMYGKPQPLIFFCNAQNTSNLLIRIRQGQDVHKALYAIEKVLNTYNPGYPFEYTFLDDAFNNLFRSENMIGKLSRLFAILAVVISCLGLFGLAAYTAERRTKEIGIRKVLGASMANLLMLLSKDFLQLLFLAFIIAFPLAWWSMHNWLMDYEYRIKISWMVFVFAGSLATIIAMLTVSFQTVKASLSNPVKSLRTE